MAFHRFAVGAALAGLVTVAACGHPAGWFGNIPGDSCSDRGSIGAVRASYEQWRAYHLKSNPPIVWPEMRAIRKVADVPVDADSDLAKFYNCNGLAAFEDDTTKAIRFGWSRSFKPNWVSANAKLYWCIDGQHDRCP